MKKNETANNQEIQLNEETINAIAKAVEKEMSKPIRIDLKDVLIRNLSPLP